MSVVLFAAVSVKYLDRNQQLKNAMTAKKFGARLRFLRTVLNVTQVELARRVEITPQHVSRIELGLTSPSFPLIDRICQALDVAPGSLFLFSDGHAAAGGDSGGEDGMTVSMAASSSARLFTWTGLWMIAPRTNGHAWSKSVFSLLGYQPYSVKPTLRRFLKHVHPDDRPRFTQAYDLALSGDRTSGLSFRLCRKGGMQRQGLFRVDPIRFADDHPGHVVAMVSDVTEWHVLERSLVQDNFQLEEHVRERNKELSKVVERYERELRRATERLNETLFHERVVAIACDGHAMVDSRLIYRHVNESFEDIVGLPREKILGRHLADVIGRELFQTVVRARVTQVLQGESASFEQWRDCPIKGRRYVHVSYAPYRIKRDVAGIVMTIKDLTEFKEAEDRLAACERQCRRQAARIRALTATGGEE